MRAIKYVVRWGLLWQVLPICVELGGEVLGFAIEAMVAPALEGQSRRYEELKESVRALRAQVRNGNALSSNSSTASAAVGSIAPTALADAGCASTGTSFSRAVTPRLNFGGVDPRIGAPDESFSMQHLRLQLHIEMQERKEEIKKLQAQQRGKAQQVENLENDHRARRKKLEARIERQTEGICTLEAQLSNRINVNQQELQAQAYAFAAKLRQFEDEKCEELEALKRQYEATRAATETIHRAETSQARMAEAGILKRAENAEAEVKDLADKMKGLQVELVSLRKQIAHAQESVAKKDEGWNSKMDELKASYESRLRELRTQVVAKEEEKERVKEDLTKKHTLEMQSYKMQKAREMECVAERVRAAVENKDATITMLKEELAQQREQATALLDMS